MSSEIVQTTHMSQKNKKKKNIILPKLCILLRSKSQRWTMLLVWWFRSSINFCPAALISFTYFNKQKNIMKYRNNKWKNFVRSKYLDEFTLSLWTERSVSKASCFFNNPWTAAIFSPKSGTVNNCCFSETHASSSSILAKNCW